MKKPPILVETEKENSESNLDKKTSHSPIEKLEKKTISLIIDKKISQLRIKDIKRKT